MTLISRKRLASAAESPNSGSVPGPQNARICPDSSLSAMRALSAIIFFQRSRTRSLGYFEPGESLRLVIPTLTVLSV